MSKILNNGGRLGKTVDYNASSAYTTGSSNKKNSGIWNLDSAVKVANADYSAFTGSASAQEDGFDYSFSYPVTGVADGTTVDITASGTNITTSDFGSTGGWNSSLTQTVTITGGNIAFSFNASADAFTEGSETVTFTLAATDSAGNQTGSPSLSVTITDDSKTVSYGISTATGYTNPSSMNEGTFTYYYFYTANRTEANPVTMYWYLNNATTSDFAATSGTCQFVTQVNDYPNTGDTANIYRVGLSTSADLLTEGAETFFLFFREVAYGISGPNLAGIQVVVNDTSTTVTYGLLSISDSTPDEGTTPRVTFYTTGYGGTMYWSIDSGTSDFSLGSGSFSPYDSYYDEGAGTWYYYYAVDLSVTADQTTEGNEAHYVRFRSGSTAGTVRATATLTVQDTSTTPASSGSDLSPALLTLSGQSATWSTYNIDLSSYVGSTGRLVFYYETTSSYTADLQLDNISLNGTAYNFTSSTEAFQTTTVDTNSAGLETTAHYESLSFSGVPTGTSTYRWNRDSGGTPSSGTGLTTDANGSTAGFYLYPETSVTHPASYWLRSPEVTLSTGTCSIAVARSGATIGTLKVYWYGTPVGTDYSSSFTQIASRQIDSDTFMGTSADYTGSYDVHVTDPVAWTGTTGRVYLATKVTSSTTYYSDLPIACVQHFNSAGTLQNSWNFSSSTGGTGSGWTTTTSGVTQPDPGMTTTPAVASAYSYSSIGSGSNVNRFNWATSTGSSYTGAAGGISTTYDTTEITTSVSTNGAISQVGSSYFMYMEASGSTHNQAHFARSPLVTINSGDYFKIAYAVTGYSTNPQNPDDCLWFGIY